MNLGQWQENEGGAEFIWVWVYEPKHVTRTAHLESVLTLVPVENTQSLAEMQNNFLGDLQC